MDKRTKTFEIIRFTADNRRYYPASMERESWMPENYEKHTEIDIQLGQSRYGGPVIDLPKGVKHPKNFRFAAQLDLSKFAPFDKTGLLPKTGQLIFFADIVNDSGKVIYANVPNESLVRAIKEHEDNFFLGVLVDKIFSDTEKWEDRFREPNGKWDNEHKNEDGKLWDHSAGSANSKIFGIYTHCQYEENEIERITFSEKILLLQVGENGFNDEGVFSVLIDREDLINLRFENCEFAWGQS
jgi:uncharacterized protein YwqG